MTIAGDSALAALVKSIEARPLRTQPWRGRVNLERVAAPLAPLFRAWDRHQVGTIRIGELTLSDRIADRELPTMTKGEQYDGAVDIDHDAPRTDILVIAAIRGGTYLALRRHDELADSPIEIDAERGTETWRSSLGDEIARAVTRAREAGDPTDLDPFL